MTQKKILCKCAKCVSACKQSPGAFLPSQIPALLKHFKVRSLVELIAKGHVVVDFKYEWPDPNRRAQELYYIMPNMKSNKGYKRNNCPKDTTCKYLVDDKCSIHMVKPYECAQMLHNDGMKKYEIRHKKIMDAWRNYDGLKEIITVRGRVKVELSQ